MNRDAAVRLVNQWIEEYRFHLKDGGGASGVHAQAKEALINLIAEVLASRPPIMSTPEPEPKPKLKRNRGRPSVAEI